MKTDSPFENKLQIEVEYARTAQNDGLFLSDEFSPLEFSGHVKRVNSTGRRGFGAGGAEVAEFLISFAGTVASSVVADWLYDKIKARSNRLSLEGKPVYISREAICAAVENSISRGNRKPGNANEQSKSSTGPKA